MDKEKKENLELFESEWVILQVVWELEPCAAPRVQEELKTKKGWAYTTVKAMMDPGVYFFPRSVSKIRNFLKGLAYGKQNQTNKSTLKTLSLCRSYATVVVGS